MNPNDKGMIVYEARGVCLILGPWNFPLGLVFGPLAAAVAAGNCCMVKLTDLCPNTAHVAGVIVREVFDENEVALFEGDVLKQLEAPELPTEQEFVASIAARKVRGTPRPLELSEEERKALPAPEKRETQQRPEPVGPARSYPPLEPG